MGTEAGQGDRSRSSLARRARPSTGTLLPYGMSVFASTPSAKRLRRRPAHVPHARGAVERSGLCVEVCGRVDGTAPFEQEEAGARGGQVGQVRPESIGAPRGLRASGEQAGGDGSGEEVARQPRRLSRLEVVGGRRTGARRRGRRAPPRARTTGMSGSRAARSPAPAPCRPFRSLVTSGRSAFADSPRRLPSVAPGECIEPVAMRSLAEGRRGGKAHRTGPAGGRPDVDAALRPGRG